MIARSTLWRTIQLGERFYDLTEREQRAVLAHEEGHIKHWHAWKRLAWILSGLAFLKTEKFFEMCEAQEMEADRYAARKGHTAGLLSFLLKHDPYEKLEGYPTIKQRIKAITNV